MPASVQVGDFLGSYPRPTRAAAQLVHVPGGGAAHRRDQRRIRALSQLRSGRSSSMTHMLVALLPKRVLLPAVRDVPWICIAFLAKSDRVQSRNSGKISMKFRPLHDRVLVRRVEQEAKTTGGIIIPDTAQEKPMEGDVIAVGPGTRGEGGKVHPLDVKAGDRVLFGKWSGTEVKIDGEELMIMKESDVMGIVDSGAAAGNKS